MSENKITKKSLWGGEYRNNIVGAFTIIELVVAITILAVLVSLASFSLRRNTEIARLQQIMYDIKSLESALEIVKLREGKYLEESDNTTYDNLIDVRGRDVVQSIR